MIKKFRFLALAALLVLPLAACDEGETVAPMATGSVTGTVTVDGVGQAGVTATLSSGKSATTSTTGQYTIGDVPEGSYTVTISGAPADVAFPSLTQAAVVRAGQVATVNFAGSRIRTSSIIGAVTGTAGAALNNVTVTLSGTEARTTTTSGAGQFSFTGLRAGAYTVTMTTPTGQVCAAPTQNTTVAAGETKVANFTCAVSSTGTISGILFLDENPKNKLFDGGALEDTLKVANIAVTLEGPTLGNNVTQQTTAIGRFSFTNLAPGTYNVRVDGTSANLSSGLAYGGLANYAVTIASGGTATVNFPFDVTSQTIRAYAFLGRDVTPAPAGISTTIPRGVAPISGVIIDLFPTSGDAVAGTNRLVRDTTDATGEVQFTFLRTADTSPGGAIQDQLVFAQFVSAPTLHTLNGETRIEIRYNSRVGASLAADTFDLLNSQVIMALDATRNVSGVALVGWAGALWLNDTTTSAIARSSAISDSRGRVTFVDTIGTAALPDTFFMRLSGTQAAAVGVAFDQTPVVQRGTVANKYLRWIHNGTTTLTDTVDVGDAIVTFSQTSVMVRVYHERDDSVAGGPPRMSSGDNIENADNIQVELRWRQTGATADSVRKDIVQTDGVYTFLNVPTNQTGYTLNARSLVANQLLLNDTAMTLGGKTGRGDFTGGNSNTMVCPLGKDTLAGCATFAFKYNNGVINGRVKAADSTGAEGLIVTLAPVAGLIQPTTTFSDTTDANGLFGFAGLREGRYTLNLGTTAVWSLATSQANPITDTIQGNGDVDIKNFLVRKLDTSIKGVVVNDRDQDANVIDPGEALAGVIIQLYRNNSNTSTTAITLDTLVKTATTDANGAYTFSNLPEARYV
ncbi:MAG: hypothetical protein EXR95_04050, partial [Gemmatimonadetes bacterium]|nr:hypothetical protein [Gemmatimonadota bacterium]